VTRHVSLSAARGRPILGSLRLALPSLFDALGDHPRSNSATAARIWRRSRPVALEVSLAASDTRADAVVLQVLQTCEACAARS